MPHLPPKTRHLTIFAVALASLVYQVLVTRLFSVTLYYHFAFAGISFAMLGLTVGAVRVFTSRRDVPPQEELARAVLRFALAMPLAFVAHWWLPGALPYAWWLQWMPVVTMGGFIVPFIYSGIIIALLLTRAGGQVARLYASDLAGAALGCLLVLALLSVLDPLGIVLWLSAMVAALTLLIRRSRVPVSVLALVVCAVVQTVTYASGQPLLSLSHAKFKVMEEPLFERWNSYSRVSVFPIGDEPFGWGFGIPTQARVPQYMLHMDAMAGTPVTRFSGDLSAVDYLKIDVTNLPYHIRKVNDAAVIGIGGGRDILSGLVFGAKSITGIEMNPVNIEALTGRFGEFSGHLEQQPGVRFVNAEARSYLNQNDARYDLVHISMIDTFASIASGGLTLSENKLYTTEAWTDFLARLNEGGMLSVSRWYQSSLHTGEYYRMLSIARESLHASGVEGDVRAHVMAAYAGAYGYKIVTVLVSKTPFGEADIAAFRAAQAQYTFRPLFVPTLHEDDALAVSLLSGEADAAFYASLPVDLTAPTDDRPFFFAMTRFADTFFSASDEQKIGKSAIGRSMFFTVYSGAVTLLWGLLLFTVAVLGVMVLRPLLAVRAALPLTWQVVYFSGIGLGFMLIEISQMQRLIILLGHPVYGLSVVLFTLLLSSGIGSLSVPAAPSRVLLRPVMLCTVLVLLGVFMPVATALLHESGTVARIVASVLLLAPAGFFMGMMFPLGASQVQGESRMAWLWGINGAASVFASVFAVALSMAAGITAAYWAGVACYAVCALSLVMRRALPQAA